MGRLLTFLEGVTTFVSPCMLPLLPVYVAFFAGGYGEDGGVASEGRKQSALVGSLSFVLGFSVVFVAMGALAGTVGSLMAHYHRALEVACGILLIVLGLDYMGLISIPLPIRGSGVGTVDARRGLVSCFAFGLAFAVGWSPCVGTFLSAALSMAAASGSAGEGVLLLGCYCAGLGLPFVLCAVLLDQLSGAIGWVKSHYSIIERASGTLLVMVGLLMATGYLGLWMRLFTL